MTSPILTTKLYIPQPHFVSLVPRPSLLARLNEGLRRAPSVTLIAAPAGSGKTTLVSSWLAQWTRGPDREDNFSPASLPPCSPAWLSLDEADNDLIRFWTYLITALQTIRSDLGQTVLAVLESPSFNSPDLLPRIKNLLAELINEIAAQPDRLILVLDDYHLIQTAGIHHSLNFFLDHLPPQLHLAFISREDPPFPLARLRVRRQLTEIRNRDLQFTLEEATQFLNQTMRLDLQPEAIAALERRTEGWVAGLQMAAIALQAHLGAPERANPTDFIAAFAGDDRYVVDYLIAEVLERQPAHILDFLQQTSILKRFTAALCQAVTGQEQASQILAYLEEANLFLVALDNRREWYRYHHLFGNLLYHRLRQTDQTSFLKLHRLASRWYQEHGFPDEAIDYALAGQDYDAAADLIEQVGLKMVGQARLNPLHHWIAALPEALIAERPYLATLLAWVSALMMQMDDTGKWLESAEQSLLRLQAGSKIKLEITCQIAMLHGYIARSQFNLVASIAHIQQAIQNLPADNAFLKCTAYLNLGGNYWLLGDFSALEAPLNQAVSFLDRPDTNYPALAGAGFLVNAYLQRGQLDQAARICRQVERELAQRRRPPPASAYVYIEQGKLLYEQNQLDAAADILAKAIQLGENLDGIVSVGRARLLLAWIKHASGQTEEMIALLEQASSHRPGFDAEFDDHKVRLWLARGHITEARQWARTYEERRSLARPWGVLSELTLAHVLLAGQQPEQALDILAQCQASSQSSGVTGWLIRALALQALGYQALNEADQALESLKQALALAEPVGYVRLFIDHGLPMQQLLQQAATRGIAPAYTAKLLTVFRAGEQGSRGAGEQGSRGAGEQRSRGAEEQTSYSSPPRLEESLNERELSILRLMAAGLSNREIAEELYLSVNTVKWYGSQIYGKLGVRKRAEAVDRAHELGIL